MVEDPSHVIKLSSYHMSKIECDAIFGSKRIYISKYETKCIASKHIKQVLFTCFASKRIGGFYMRNE
jgi:hypothetical protein